MWRDPYLRMLNKLYNAGVNRPVDVTEYMYKIVKINPNFPKRTIKDEGQILLKRIQENQHISFYFKENEKGEKRVLAEIQPFGHDFMEQKKTNKGSRSLGRAAIIMSIISIIVTGYFTYKSNDVETRITEVERKVLFLQQSVSNQNIPTLRYNKKKQNP